MYLQKLNKTKDKNPLVQKQKSFTLGILTTTLEDATKGKLAKVSLTQPKQHNVFGVHREW